MPAALRRLRPLDVVNIVVAVVVWVLVILGSDPTIDVSDPFSGQVVTAQDARSYYGFDLDDLYTGRTDWNTIGAYPYSPAFAQLVYPLNLLPWTWFVAAWTAILIGAVWLLTGRELFLVGLVIGAMEIAGGQHLAAAGGRDRRRVPAPVDLGVRAAHEDHARGRACCGSCSRREWRQLAIALGATAGVVARLVRADAPRTGSTGSTCCSRTPARAARGRRSRSRSLIRGPIGVALIIWGAPRNQRWVVPVACDARAAGAVVRLAVDAARRHPAHDARGALAWLGPVQGVRALAASWHMGRAGDHRRLAHPRRRSHSRSVACRCARPERAGRVVSRCGPRPTSARPQRTSPADLGRFWRRCPAAGRAPARELGELDSNSQRGTHADCAVRARAVG